MGDRDFAVPEPGGQTYDLSGGLQITVKGPNGRFFLTPVQVIAIAGRMLSDIANGEDYDRMLRGAAMTGMHSLKVIGGMIESVIEEKKKEENGPQGEAEAGEAKP